MRIENKELCAKYRDMPCVVCGGRNLVTGHHLRSKGSGGDDIKENLIPLCFNHHTEIHTMPTVKFCSKYSSAKYWLLGLGWFYDVYKEKFMHKIVYHFPE